jgi:hypothetical protein
MSNFLALQAKFQTLSSRCASTRAFFGAHIDESTIKP